MHKCSDRERDNTDNTDFCLNYGVRNKMTFSDRSPLKKVSRARGQSSGWAAFDLKQRQKYNVESEAEKDSFPPIGSSDFMEHGDKLIKKKHFPVKTFSSVLLPDKTFQSLKGGNRESTIFGSDSGGKYGGTTAQEDVNLATKKLKEQHPWAENSLIEDVLAVVSNNVGKALTLFETMASAGNFEECRITSNPGPATSDDIPSDEKTDENLTLGKFKNEIPFRYSLVGHLNNNNNNKDLEDRNASSDQKLPDDDNLRCKIGLLNSVPVEPEWEEEEDDIYIRHRKDALKTMRYA